MWCRSSLHGFARYARWDRFSHAEPLPKYGVSGLPSAMVVGRAEGGEDRRTHLIERFRMPSPSRRDVLVVAAGAALAGLAPKAALAQDKDKAEAHGISAFGDLKYPADFKHFDYVNPNAPKGGMFSQIGPTRQLTTRIS